MGSPWGAGIVKAAAFVDATGSAEIAAAAGATCRVIGADHVAVQNQGYAAGYMAAQSALRGAGYRDIDLPAVQRHLAEVGVLDKQALSFEEPFVLSSDRVAEAVAGDLMDAEIRPRPDKNDNSVRNQSLKEIHLARALVACGDHEGLGRQILEAYAGDFRGHYLRHAQALLEKGCARNTAA